MDSKATILITDDEQIVRETLKVHLSREGYDIVLAVNAAEALHLLESTPIDVILSDVMMPEMDGFELCKRIKNNKGLQHIPLILVTALNSKDDLVKGIDSGANDFLSKPVSGVELRARVRSMIRIKRQYDALQESLRSREELAQLVVHDLKNPLTNVMFGLDMLQHSEDLNEEVSSQMQRISEQAKRLNGLIEELLVTAKMDAGKLLLSRRDIAIRDFMQEVERNNRTFAEARDISLAFEYPEDGLLSLSIDRSLMLRTMDNLISNAIKYSDPYTSVVVRLAYLDSANESERDFDINIIDQGYGVPDADKESIFNKFEIGRLKQSGVRQHGLGLSFCKMVIEAHGGIISVVDNHPAGSIFKIEL